MKHFIYTLLTLFLFACGNEPVQEESAEPVQTEETATEETDADALMAEINAERLETEKMLSNLKKSKMASSNLIPTVARRWSDIVFHSDGSGLRRVKTLPQEVAGEETREYYFKDGMLRCVVIEGEGANQTEEQDIDGTVLYFDNGELIREMETADNHSWSELENVQDLIQEADYYKKLHDLTVKN